jgi:hypothetical protein
MRKFNKLMKRGGFHNKNKDKDKIKTKRTSKRPWFGCGKEGHFIADCHNVKVRRRDTNKLDKRKHKKKEVGEAHLGDEWDSNEESSDSDEEVGLATKSIAHTITKSSLFGDLTNDEDDFTHTCLIVGGTKVESKTLSHDEDDDCDLNNEFEKILNNFVKKATKRIMTH